jgi:hypothetical protein
MPPHSPFRQQLIPAITKGLPSPVAAQAMKVSPNTINRHRRLFNSPSPKRSTTPDIHTTKYAINTTKRMKKQHKLDAVLWAREELPVKSGSKKLLHLQYESNKRLFNDYVVDMMKKGLGNKMSCDVMRCIA